MSHSASVTRYGEMRGSFAARWDPDFASLIRGYQRCRRCSFPERLLAPAADARQRDGDQQRQCGKQKRETERAGDEHRPVAA